MEESTDAESTDEESLLRALEVIDGTDESPDEGSLLGD